MHDYFPLSLFLRGGINQNFFPPSNVANPSLVFPDSALYEKDNLLCR